jgi:hypothetical protein
MCAAVLISRPNSAASSWLRLATVLRRSQAGSFRRADNVSQEARKAGRMAAILWHRNGGTLLHDQVWQLAARYRHVAFAQADVASSEHCAKLAAAMQVRARSGRGWPWVGDSQRTVTWRKQPAPA